MTDTADADTTTNTDATTTNAKPDTLDITPIDQLVSALQIAGSEVTQLSGKLAATQHFPASYMLETFWLHEVVENATRLVAAVNRYQSARRLASTIPAGSA